MYLFHLLSQVWKQLLKQSFTKFNKSKSKNVLIKQALFFILTFFKFAIWLELQVDSKFKNNS